MQKRTHAVFFDRARSFQRRGRCQCRQRQQRRAARHAYAPALARGIRRPGTYSRAGKTSAARNTAEITHAKFIRISGVESNVAEMRRVIATATNRLRTSGQKTILFIDEIHHFNKAQQDILLPDVETGNLRLIGATTYNPFFYVNSALVSRSQVFQLEPLRVEQLEELIDRALTDKD